MPRLLNSSLFLIHIPKTAGTSLVNKFGKDTHVNWNRLSRSHKTLPEMWDTEWFKYYKNQDLTYITVVRNPWDRLVSVYKFSFIHKWYKNTSLTFKEWVEKEPLDRLEEYYPKEEYVLKSKKLGQRGDILHLYSPQYRFVYDENMNTHMDHILRYETLDRDLEKIDTTFLPLPKSNISKDNMTTVVPAEIR